MKIREIVVEENPIADLLVKGVTKLAPGVWKAQAAKKQALEALTKAWAEELHNTGKITTSADSIIEKQFAQDKGLVAQAAKDAKAAAKEIQAAKNFEYMKGAMSETVQTAAIWGRRIGFGMAIYECYDDVQALNEEYRNGSIDQTAYAAQMRSVLGAAATKIAGIIVAGPVVNLAGKITQTITILPFSGAIGKFISSFGTSGVASAAFATWLATPMGSKAFAQWYVGSSMPAEWTRQIMGNWTKSAYDYVFKSVEQIANGKSPNAPFSDPDAPVGDDIKNISSQLPAGNQQQGQQYDPVTHQWVKGKLN